MYCDGCGDALPARGRYCPQCGTPKGRRRRARRRASLWRTTGLLLLLSSLTVAATLLVAGRHVTLRGGDEEPADLPEGLSGDSGPDERALGAFEFRTGDGRNDAYESGRAPRLLGTDSMAGPVDFGGGSPARLRSGRDALNGPFFPLPSAEADRTLP